MQKTITTFLNKARRKLNAYTISSKTKSEIGSLGKVVRHPDHRHTFCGYYDRSPWSPDGKHLLVLCVDAEQIPERPELAHIYKYELSSGIFTHISSTYCWNFQQGAQQQWWGNDRILFNSEHNGQAVAKVFAIKPEIEQIAEIPGSIGMANQKQELVTLYDYGPMSVFETDYSYKALNCDTDFKASNQHLKITIWALKEGKPLLTIQPSVLNKIDNDDAMSCKGTRYIQHVKFNDLGTKIMFVLRSAHETRKVSFSSLYSYDLASGQTTRLISTKKWQSGCNHPVWGNNDEVLVNLVDKDYKARKFQLINATDASCRIIAPKHDGVGHPTICNDNAFVLTDEYMVDKSQILTSYSLSSGKRKVLGRFNAAKYPKGENRCDLHPRYDKNSNVAAVDHYHEKGRVVTLVAL